MGKWILKEVGTWRNASRMKSWLSLKLRVLQFAIFAQTLHESSSNNSTLFKGQFCFSFRWRSLIVDGLLRVPVACYVVWPKELRQEPVFRLWIYCCFSRSALHTTEWSSRKKKQMKENTWTDDQGWWHVMSKEFFLFSVLIALEESKYFVNVLERFAKWSRANKFRSQANRVEENFQLKMQ